MSILATFAVSIHRMVRVWDPRTGNCVATRAYTPYASDHGQHTVADSLAIGMDAGILVIRPGVTG